MERRSAEVEEGRDTVLLHGGGFIRRAVAGSRSSETEGHLLSADVGMCRRGTDDTVDAGGCVTRMMAAGSGPRSSEMEGDFLLCEVGARQKIRKKGRDLWAGSRRRRRNEEQ